MDIPPFMHIRVIEARGLASADINGLSDPYATLQLSNSKEIVRSKTINETLEPQWKFDHTFMLPDSASALDELDLLIRVYDEDTLNADDFLGGCKFIVTDFLRHQVVSGWFELRKENWKKVAKGKIHILVAFGDEKLKFDQRTRMLDGYQTKLDFMLMKLPNKNKGGKKKISKKKKPTALQ